MSDKRIWCSENAFASCRSYYLLTKLSQLVLLSYHPEDFVIGRMITYEVRFLCATFTIFIVSYSSGTRVDRSKKFSGIEGVSS